MKTAHTKHARVAFAVIVFILLTLIAWIVRPIPGSGPPSRRALCRSNLKIIGLALREYHDHYGSFPPLYVADSDNVPQHSWRVLLLPFLDQSPLFHAYRLNEPWNSAHNLALARNRPSIYACTNNSRNDMVTSYVALTGYGTAWPTPPETCRIADVHDGLYCTAQVAEINNSDIVWTEPRDIAVVQVDNGGRLVPTWNIQACHKGGAHVLFIGGAEYVESNVRKSREMGCVRFLLDSCPTGVLRSFTTISGGEACNIADYDLYYTAGPPSVSVP